MGKKILLAEDSLTIQKVFELTFRQSDVALTMVDNGIDAVRLAGEIAPDLVVADVSLPGKDGFEVAAELRNSEKTRSCPVLVLTGTLAPFDEGKFRDSGAAGVLFKPFESQELIDKVEGLLSGPAPPSSAGEKETGRQPGGEPWDFSDVIEEVEEETAAAAPPVLHRGEDLLPGASVVSMREEGSPSLGEFDVSMEDIAPPEPSAFSPPPEPPPPKEAPEAAHMESEYFDDSPQAVTDLTAAFDAIEEIEEIDAMEEMELPGKAAEAPPVPEEPSFRPPASLPTLEAVEPPPSVPPPPEPPREAGEGIGEIVDAGAPKGAGAAAGSAEAADAFSARAQEIIGRIAAETVEKVMWETMDRLSAEFSEKIREAVEKVAWEVIPATAETLIREEISRIRQQAGKRSS